MNEILSIALSPVVSIVLQWTLLLALGWTAHWALRRRHPRWRVILWRSILCFALFLPCLHVLPFPVIEVPVIVHRDFSMADIEARSPIEGELSVSSVQPTVSASKETPAPNPPMAAAPFHEAAHSATSFSWMKLLFALWVIGFLFFAFRLVRLHLQLVRMRNESDSAGPAIHRMAKELQARFCIRRKMIIRESAHIRSPFVFGVLQPTVMLPRRLLATLSPTEISAILIHEIAHIRHRDVLWCVAWRWIAALLWFHPLVWRVPAAHTLACELEADRMASERLEDRASYARTLAQVALGIVRLPAAETGLTANGTSQIVRRLNHLGKKGIGAWKWKHTVAAFCLVTILLLMAAGWRFVTHGAVAEMTLQDLRIAVQDEAGNPVEGATLLTTALRVHSDGPNSFTDYAWDPGMYGPPVSRDTDHLGEAIVKYPVETVPAEKWRTRALVVSINHPDFAPSFAKLLVDGSSAPVQLSKGIELEVSGYFGEDREPVMEIVPNLSRGDSRSLNWIQKENGALASSRLAPGAHLLQLMGRLPTGEIVHSEVIEFLAEHGEKQIISLEMLPGIRLEGRLDDAVPRPVTSGRVVIAVRSKELAPLKNEETSYLRAEYGSFRHWSSDRPIAEDGSFVFESIPPGEVDVIAYGEGFVSSDGAELILSGRSEPQRIFRVPQVFPASAPITSIEVDTEATSTLEVTAMAGRVPVEGATVFAYPSDLRLGAFGRGRSAVTDKNGVAIFRNLPAHQGRLTVHHPNLEVPAQGDYRVVRFDVQSGETGYIDLSLQPKGREFAGRPPPETKWWAPMKGFWDFLKSLGP